MVDEFKKFEYDPDWLKKEIEKRAIKERKP